MLCPNCQGVTKTTDSRMDSSGDSIYRKRLCLICGTVFRTIEIDLDLYENLVKCEDVQFCGRIGRKRRACRNV